MSTLSARCDLALRLVGKERGSKVLAGKKDKPFDSVMNKPIKNIAT